MEENQYTKDFYNSQRFYSRLSGRNVLPLVFKLIKVNSVLDVGCGTGEWLRAAKDLGVNDICGLDGHYVDRDLLAIPKENFIDFDLKGPIDLNRKFDLVISMEVAEHLPENVSDLFINSLTNHSDFVLFSAAIPKQDGTYHINEQFQDFWVEKFENQGYLPIDFLRSRLWAKKGIDWWYKQNMILYVRKSILESNNQLNDLYLEFKKSTYNRQHPEMTFLLNKIKSPLGRFIKEPKYTMLKFLNYFF
ncbi:MAG: class I SAM-dependent methyltransferase [Bacteroidia bacterium]|nr:class I SAM-dependent methyltransferase [Bacteroidia bacterium]MCF8425698.1 class I SAM-dependent methyltransferase [Bacteroidia bacterium]MCF8446008.1 class I SAM-dependent methyltransferase [Bacteroidia bacterium]